MTTDFPEGEKRVDAERGGGERGLTIWGHFEASAGTHLPTSVRCHGRARLEAGARIDGDLKVSEDLQVGDASEIGGRVQVAGPVRWHVRALAGALASDGPLSIGPHVVADAVEARRGMGGEASEGVEVR